MFISYSHKDEEYKDALLEHMASLRRTGEVEEWHDRKIEPGKNWKNEISQHLHNSTIIIFLISASFINSDYCVEVEAKTAFEKHLKGEALLIPIVIRPTHWNDSEFANIQSLPKDSKPVTTWENADMAWLDVVQGIKVALSEFKPENNMKKIINPGSQSDISPTEYIFKWLNDTEITLTHRNVTKISLDQIFITPDLEIKNENRKDDLKSYYDANDILTRWDEILIVAEEQQGKTSLLKYYYKDELINGFLPLYIDGNEIKKSNVQELISEQLIKQYTNLNYEDYIASNKGVILLDNVDKIGLNPKFRDIFLNTLNETFKRKIYTSRIAYLLIINEISSLINFKKAEVLGLGHKKREQLIQKWVSLGIEETIQENELYLRCDDLKERVNTVVKRNIVPSKPIYILMILQMFEAHKNLNLELSSHGHCYQQLIYQSFENAKINEREYDKYLNVLTELAWAIFTKEKDLNASELDDFFDFYQEEFLKIDKDVILQKLKNHSILIKNDLATGFKYPYIYYFFVGKKIAESFSEDEDSKLKVDFLLENMHREDFANILIFITHHTKDAWVLEKIKEIMQSLFESVEEASLEKSQLKFMDEFIKQIPELIIEQRSVQSERDKHNESLDLAERSNSGNIDDFEKDSGELSKDILANINKTFKGMEISGQIIRNRHASLKRKSLHDLAEYSIKSGLRFLQFFITISDMAKKEIIQLISLQLAENPSLSNQEIKKYAENMYTFLTYNVMQGVIRKISASIGSKEALEVYDKIKSENETPALILLNQCIRLHFNKKVDVSELSDTVEKLKSNPVCFRILKELVVQHIYMFPTDYKEKQQLSALLELPIQQQNLIGKQQKTLA